MLHEVQLPAGVMTGSVLVKGADKKQVHFQATKPGLQPASPADTRTCTGSYSSAHLGCSPVSTCSPCCTIGIRVAPPTSSTAVSCRGLGAYGSALLPLLPLLPAAVAGCCPCSCCSMLQGVPAYCSLQASARGCSGCHSRCRKPAVSSCMRCRLSSILPP